MANMAEIVSGDSAHVHAHFTLHFWLELLLLLSHCVVQPQWRERWNRRLGRAQRTETITDKALLLRDSGESDWDEGFVEFEERSHFAVSVGLLSLLPRSLSPESVIFLSEYYHFVFKTMFKKYSVF